jgi:hypothetical protein
MNGAEKLSADKNQEWQSLETYAKDHPFEEAPSNTETEAESQNTPDSSEQETFEDPVFKGTEEPIPELSIPGFGSRERYIKWSAFVIPDVTKEEIQVFLEKFGGTDVHKDLDYIELVKNIPSDHPDVFNPSIESIKETTEPFLELIRQDTEGLINIAQKLESSEANQESLELAVAFFCEKFDVKSAPTIGHFAEDEERDGCQGTYNKYSNHIRIRQLDSPGNLDAYIDTLAHEVWHAHQAEYETEHCYDDDELANKYQLNDIYPQKSSVDYDAYRNQLVEKEAFYIGDEVADIYRHAYLSAHPEEVKLLHKKYLAWVWTKYNPKQDGIDYKTLIVAHHDFKRNGKRRGKLSQKINNILFGR